MTTKRSRNRSHGAAAPATWEALALAEPLETKLRALAARARQRIDAPPATGPAAITALFVGVGRTERKRVVEVLAGELGLGVHRVDLDRLVGASGKNLDELLTATDGSAAVLFLDEADGLFSGRTDVTDAHDRYASIDVEHLLRKMESCHGLVILATNGSKPEADEVHPGIDYVVEYPGER